jgi:hypothetical protein
MGTADWVLWVRISTKSQYVSLSKTLNLTYLKPGMLMGTTGEVARDGLASHSGRKVLLVTQC